MTNQQFIIRIRRAFTQPLPGIEAHQLLASSFRPLNRNEISDFDNYRESAVALICYPHKKAVHILLIQRPQYDGHHSGQIALPGGKHEPQDANLEITARRETHEEIGWKIYPENYLGSLTELFIPESKFRVQPFVYYIEERQSFYLDKHEVANVIEFPVKQLNDPTIIKYTTIQLRDGREIPRVPYFAINKHIVWGATAIILSELRNMIT